MAVRSGALSVYAHGYADWKRGVPAAALPGDNGSLWGGAGVWETERARGFRGEEACVHLGGDDALREAVQGGRVGVGARAGGALRGRAPVGEGVTRHGQGSR